MLPKNYYLPSGPYSKTPVALDRLLGLLFDVWTNSPIKIYIYIPHITETEIELIVYDNCLVKETSVQDRSFNQSNHSTDTDEG